MSRAVYLTNVAALTILGAAAFALPSSASAQCSGSECAIGGTCIAQNALNPANSCEQCRPVTNRNAWTTLADGDPCDDLLYCTVADSCSGGVCSGLPRGCTDFAVCTDDSCDEAADTCRYAIQAGHCYIGGTCT